MEVFGTESASRTVAGSLRMPKTCIIHRPLKTSTIDVIDRIRSEEHYQTRKNALCDWCEFRSVCPAWNLHAKPPRPPRQAAAPSKKAAAPPRPTTDPEQLYGDPPGTILPMGGSQAYKGFGLAFMIDVLAGCPGRRWLVLGDSMVRDGIDAGIVEASASPGWRGSPSLRRSGPASRSDIRVD